MNGLTMQYPLTLHHLLERARQYFPDKEIVTRTANGLHRYTYRDFYRRTRRLARAIERLGVAPGDRVATLDWNTYRHFELFFAVPCSGAVLHTLNLRLAPDQLAYIVRHAQPTVIFADISLAPILEGIRNLIPSVRKFIIMSDGIGATSLAPSVDYETLLAETPDDDGHGWNGLDENAAAAMCYTTGTTGLPKGVVYSHRALVLHSMAWALPDAWNIAEKDVLMPMMSMFHACAWGTPYIAAMTGAKLVLPGPQPQPQDLAKLIEGERVTVTGGVPTVWISLYNFLEQHPHDLTSLRVIISGGMAVPRRLIEDYARRYGVRFIQGWGMTETLIDVSSALRSRMSDWPAEERHGVTAKQGVPTVGVEIRAVDESGAELPWDGAAKGELQVRGMWVSGALYDDPRSADVLSDGWFRTGDVATIDPDGYVRIVDRTKDLIKSGGEWISSIDLENVIMTHPKVLEAVVIAVPHPKWQERPLAAVVLQKQYEGQMTKLELLDFLSSRVAKWWLPDDVIFIDAVPKTSVGKFDKKALRERYAAAAGQDPG